MEHPWNILPHTQPSQRAICAHDDVPQLAPAGFLIEMGRPPVGRLHPGEGTCLRQQQRCIVGGIEDQMDVGRPQLLPL
ncbi:MAG: hypothetical protein ACK559_26040, partial [bacterium]